MHTAFAEWVAPEHGPTSVAAMYGAAYGCERMWLRHELPFYFVLAAARWRAIEAERAKPSEM